MLHATDTGNMLGYCAANHRDQGNSETTVSNRMSGVVIEELDSSEEDFGTPTSRGSTEDGFHSPHGSEKDLQGG